ncbi:MAG: hypothetical protein HKL79_03520 [Thermoplasmata archaeon]|nr:hypothetical protein [Thermoplasmata archaeon]
MTTPTSSPEDPKKAAADATAGRSDKVKCIPVYFYQPGRRLFHAWVTMAHEPGTLARILNALPVPTINLFHLTASDGSHNGLSIAHLYAEADSKTTPQELGALLHKLPGVIEAHVEEGIDGLLIDTSYPLRITRGLQAVVFDRKQLAGMVDEVREKFGSGGAVLLYDQGLALGRESWNEFLKLVGRPFAVQHLSYLGNWHSARGMGRMEVLDFSLERAVDRVRVTDSFECIGHTAPIPYSQLLRGLIAGLLSTLWDSPVTCRETRCIAMGEPACEFEIERISAEPVNEILPG